MRLTTVLALTCLLFPSAALAQEPSAERPTYALGDKWIRNDGAFELVRIEGGAYVFAQGPKREVRLSRNLGFARAQRGDKFVEYDEYNRVRTENEQLRAAWQAVREVAGDALRRG